MMVGRELNELFPKEVAPIGEVVLSVRNLTRAGIVDLVGRTLVRVTGKHPQALILMIMIAVTGLSAFISNTAATAFFVPIAIGVANRVKMSPSLVLLPLVQLHLPVLLSELSELPRHLF